MPTRWCTPPPRPTSASWSPTHRAGARPPPVPEWQPAVCRARRIPLPRGPGAPRHGRPRCARNVAVLGGGDGMAVREILKYPGVEQVTLVELDPAMTRSSARTRRWPGSMAGASSPQGQGHQHRRLQVAERHTRQVFDVIVVDFPDPTNFAIGKLYTKLLLRPAGPAPEQAAAMPWMQTTSPLVARQSFWTVVPRSSRWACAPRLPRARAQLRRMGLRHRQPRPWRCPRPCLRICVS
jgi:spermidine synthase